jgi:hypothetical protein
MSEILDAIKVWEQQNSPTIKGLDVAKQNAISQALNFFNKKFGGEGELMPIIEENVIVQTPITTLPNKGIPLQSIAIVYGLESVSFDTFENAQTWIADKYNFGSTFKDRGVFYIDCILTWEDGSQALTKKKIKVSENEEGSFNPNIDKLNKWLFFMYVSTETNFIEVQNKSFFTSWDWQIDETPKVENAINEQIKIPQMTQFELMSDVGSKLKKGDTGVFAEDYIPPNTFLDAYMNSEARPDVIYKIPFKKIRIIEEAPISLETKEAEEEVLFTDLEELENEIESINFEELEKLDKELDDLF